MADAITRRRFAALVLFAPVLTVGATRRRPASHARQGTGPHPTPRPGITAERVLSDDQLSAASPSVVAAFAAARAIPQIVDGIRCHCGCADFEGYYSLLSCYEGTAMAQHCEICQGQARMAYRLHGQGRTLDEIRSATDARYG